ncbi:hypothetical protein ATSB10_17810 [Dyella thiooxydans]|uniref:Uncharacterized protein n=1 Tax=Dyella thiooxydans TaxID=445710 RepID=A0A161J9F1_9GAMM|nr:hypothetical protein ATSB10_17810 [Dyella thiooxydans]
MATSLMHCRCTCAVDTAAWSNADLRSGRSATWTSRPRLSMQARQDRVAGRCDDAGPVRHACARARAMAIAAEVRPGADASRAEWMPCPQAGSRDPGATGGPIPIGVMASNTFLSPRKHVNRASRFSHVGSRQKSAPDHFGSHSATPQLV